MPARGRLALPSGGGGETSRRPPLTRHYRRSGDATSVLWKAAIR